MCIQSNQCYSPTAKMRTHSILTWINYIGNKLKLPPSQLPHSWPKVPSLLHSHFPLCSKRVCNTNMMHLWSRSWSKIIDFVFVYLAVFWILHCVHIHVYDLKKRFKNLLCNTLLPQACQLYQNVHHHHYRAQEKIRQMY